MTSSPELSIERAKHIIEQRHRARLLVTILPAFLGILFLGWSETGVAYSYFEKSPVLEIFTRSAGWGFIAVSLLSTAMIYLQTGFKPISHLEFQEIKNRLDRETNNTDIESNLSVLAEDLKLEVQRVRDELKSLKAESLSVPDADRAILVSAMMDQINNEASANLVSQLKDQIKKTNEQGHLEKNIASGLNESRERLLKEIEALSRRGNLNLALGAVTTVFGLMLLGFSVFSELTTIPKDMLVFISHFLPRFALVVMIELFAYFFLSLYKSSLSEIKYFQNELTNIEAKQASLRAAFNLGDLEIIRDVVAKLVVTERNHILTKDQTTVELEKVKIENDSRNEIVKSLSSFFKKE